MTASRLIALGTKKPYSFYFNRQDSGYGNIAQGYVVALESFQLNISPQDSCYSVEWRDLKSIPSCDMIALEITHSTSDRKSQTYK